MAILDRLRWLLRPAKRYVGILRSGVRAYARRDLRRPVARARRVARQPAIGAPARPPFKAAAG
jgi:hypothetical protein